MAILEDLGLEIKVLVDESPLKEYEDDEEVGPEDCSFGDKTRKCRRYVEIVEDAHFDIQVHVLPTISCFDSRLDSLKQRLKFAIDLDGHDTRPQSWLLRPSHSMVIKGTHEYDGRTMRLRKFKFATVRW